jgi:hypothetical protein
MLQVRRFNSKLLSLLPLIRIQSQWAVNRPKFLEAIELSPTTTSLTLLVDQLAVCKRYDPLIWNRIVEVVTPRVKEDFMLFAMFCKTSCTLHSKDHFDVLEPTLNTHSHSLRPNDIGLVIIGFNKAGKGTQHFWDTAAKLLAEKPAMNPALLSQSVLAVAKATKHSAWMSEALYRELRLKSFNSIGLSALLKACEEMQDCELYSIISSKLTKDWHNINPIDFSWIALSLKKLNKISEFVNLIEQKVLTISEFPPYCLVMLVTALSDSSSELLKNKLKSEVMNKVKDFTLKEICNLLNISVKTAYFTKEEVSVLTDVALDSPLLRSNTTNFVTLAHILNKYALSPSRLLPCINQAFLSSLSPDSFAILAFSIRAYLREPLTEVVRKCAEDQFQGMNAKHILNMAVMWTDKRLFTHSTWSALEPFFDDLPQTYVEDAAHSADLVNQHRTVITRLRSYQR